MILCQIRGQVLFASAEALIEHFDVLAVAGKPVVIDVSEAHFWDITAIGALEKVVDRLKQHGCAVEVIGMDGNTQRLMNRLKL